MRLKHCFKTYLFMILGLGIFAVPVKVYAQGLKSLTESNVERFIERTTKVINGNAENMSSEQVVRYLNEHLHDKAYFSSSIEYSIPGFGSQSTSIALKKDEFIENIGKGSQTLQNYETKISIDSVKISKDKTKATVKTTSIERGQMMVEGSKTPVEGKSSCLQILMLKSGRIQMYSANCSTKIEFQQ